MSSGRHYYVIWTHPDGDGWDGPFGEIDSAHSAVPDEATAHTILSPLAVMTPGEKREALPILERQPDAA